MPIWTPNLAGQPEGRQQRIEACSEQGLRVGLVEGAKAGVLSSATIGGLYYFSPWFKKATRIRCVSGAGPECRRRVSALSPSHPQLPHSAPHHAHRAAVLSSERV